MLDIYQNPQTIATDWVCVSLWLYNYPMELVSKTETMVATSTNHLEIIASFEATKECALLRRAIQHVPNTKYHSYPTIIDEDNSMYK